jgi:UDP-2-acetamido-3-amino-2,3-dideoxy-glucuronate N-acetyltransferase
MTLNNVLCFRSKQIIESNGILMPIEFDNSLPFKPKRTFFVYNVPDKNPRGQHAHWKTKQILTCLSGHITTILADGVTRQEYELYSGDSIFIPNLIWDEQIYHSTDTIMISLCSTHYDTKDYIHNFNEFLKIKQSKL